MQHAQRTLGLGDVIRGTFSPEEPLFEEVFVDKAAFEITRADVVKAVVGDGSYELHVLRTKDSSGIEVVFTMKIPKTLGLASLELGRSQWMKSTGFTWRPDILMLENF
jgi:hypothetical protein